LDVEIELQGKDAFREIILEGNFVQIAIWIDGEWAVVESSLYKAKSREDKPIFILNEYDFLNQDESEDFLEILIKEIEEKINVET
jgi:hypothetical protein